MDALVGAVLAGLDCLREVLLGLGRRLLSTDDLVDFQVLEEVLVLLVEVLLHHVRGEADGFAVDVDVRPLRRRHLDRLPVAREARCVRVLRLVGVVGVAQRFVLPRVAELLEAAPRVVGGDFAVAVRLVRLLVVVLLDGALEVVERQVAARVEALREGRARAEPLVRVEFVERELDVDLCVELLDRVGVQDRVLDEVGVVLVED